MSFPTADEAARIIIAAFRVTGANPLYVANKLPRGNMAAYERSIIEGRAYAALAFRKLFPSVSARAVGRMVGLPDDANFAIDTAKLLALGKLRWYDQIDFDKILRNCGVAPRAPDQTVIDETAAPVSLSSSAPRAPSFGPKAHLEEELRRAVINTGGRVD